MRRPERLVMWTLSLATLAAAGCTSQPPSMGPPDAATVCSASFAATVGAACSPEGLFCGPGYDCYGVTATAKCTCTGGVFVCVDDEGVIHSTRGALPSCSPRRDAEACPASVEKASLAPCSETMLACHYPLDCDATPAFRTCTCEYGPLPDGTEGLAFQCPDPCLYVGTPIEPAPADEGGATTDAGTTAD
ncbi:MAG: hypothetical protein ACRENE_24740 [Polyangiaceae bacterium]